MSDNLRAAAEMLEASDIPVIADCDNGYGNAINVIHTVRAYERAGVAAICIEDNVFPKRCSFYSGVKRELVTPEEHAGKIKACLDTRTSKDFAIIARTEALIAGYGMDEALRRAVTYAEAGADMILVHSKSPEPDEVLEVARRWDRNVPLVSVPTTYATTSIEALAEAGYKVVIFANHGLRAEIRAIRAAFARIMGDRRASAADELIVPLKDVYDLVGVPELRQNERTYLPAAGSSSGDTEGER
jgi:phosphoenolpyruvate phosphomutase